MRPILKQISFPSPQLCSPVIESKSVNFSLQVRVADREIHAFHVLLPVSMADNRVEFRGHNPDLLSSRGLLSHSMALWLAFRTSRSPLATPRYPTCCSVDGRVSFGGGSPEVRRVAR